MKNATNISDTIKQQIAILEQFDTPTLCNTIERFQIRSRTEGYTDYSIKEIIPHGKTFIGFACTGKISSASPAEGDSEVLARKYFESLEQTPKPAFAAIEDVDSRTIGSFWGEVNVAVHRAMGCTAVVTNGGVRDLKEVSEAGFGYYAGSVVVSHAYVHVEDYNCPVTIGGLLIHPGDLIAADQHGLISIPLEIVPELEDACRKTIAAEFPILQGSRKAILSGTNLSVDELMELRKKMYRLRVSDTV